MSGLIGAFVGIEQSLPGTNAPTVPGGIFGSFGNITFNVLGSPTELELDNKYYYAKIDVVGAAPQLEWIYDDLMVIKMKVLFHYYWSTPQDSIKALRDMAVQHTPQPFAVGKTNYGNFIISSIQERDTWRADDGTLLVAMVTIDLTEWVGQVTPNPAPSNPPPGTASAPSGSSVSYSHQPALQSVGRQNINSGPSTPYTDFPLDQATRMA